MPFTLGSSVRIVPVLLLPILLSCQTGYVTEQGTEFLRLMHRRVPIEQAQKDDALNTDQRKQLRRVPQVRSFANQRFNLQIGDAYTTYVHLDRSAVSWNITATQPYRIHPFVWSFPMVGSFPYIGFFNRSDATRYKDWLISEGYEVHMRPVRAFSTLGWFSDPIYSPMLEYPEPIFVETIFHELIHAHIFFEDHVSLNESIASELGRVATIEFLKSKHGSSSNIVQWTRRYHADQTRVKRFFLNLRTRLKRVYDTDRPDSWKQRKKRHLFMRARRSFLNLLDQMETNGWNQLLSESWNNAYVTSRGVYSRYTRRIRTLWQVAFDGDLAKTFQFLSDLDTSRPVERINERIRKERNNRSQKND